MPSLPMSRGARRALWWLASGLLFAALALAAYIRFEYTLVGDFREAVATVDPTDPVALGQLLFATRGCAGCHTPEVKGEPLPGMEFAGGFEFLFPAGTIRSLNITPDVETGIGKLSREDFIARFKAFASEESRDVTVSPAEFNTPMPWLMYARMTDEDLGRIYEYLRTVKPVTHQVEKFTPKETKQ